MANQLFAFLNHLLPTSIAVKGLSKLNPKMARFFTNATAAGFGTDQALSFLRNKFQSPGPSGEQTRLQKGSQQGTLRPDEAASLQKMNQSQQVPNLLQKGIAGVAGLGAGLEGYNATDEEQPEQIASQPSNIAAQPQQSSSQSSVAQQSQSQGFDPLAGLSQFPELIKFIQSEASSGGNAQSIASKARKSTKLRTFVDTIEQTANEPFENLLSRLLGSSGNQQQQGAGTGQALNELKGLIGQYMQIKSSRK